MIAVVAQQPFVKLSRSVSFLYESLIIVHLADYFLKGFPNGPHVGKFCAVGLGTGHAAALAFIWSMTDFIPNQTVMSVKTSTMLPRSVKGGS